MNAQRSDENQRTDEKTGKRGQTPETPASETAVALRVDDTPVTVAAGATILDACRSLEIATPTICYADTLTPVNVCRVCVVELEGGMVVRTDTERVRHSRKMVLEFLATGVDLSEADELAPWVAHYGADPDRYGPSVKKMDEPIRIQDELYIRDYDKCVLCYKCVEACGDDAQHTYAISIAGRGYGARVSTEFDVALPDSACVYCGNCVAVCPTNALQFHSEYQLRQADDWRPEDQTVTTTVCSYCGVGCNLELHVQDNRIVKCTSPDDHDVTRGNLCIKGRFGWSYV
jgi:predicted molibdopterin-dependent oxidoreductase YjgC